MVNSERELVGMVVGTGEYGSGMLTPLKDIMVDIEQATGRRVSLPQPKGHF